MSQTVYLYIKAFHLISIISWLAGLFYLPRLYAYHADAAAGSPQSETFKIMERRLLRVIMNPAMIASWIFGLTLVFGFNVINWKQDIWFHAKLTLVIVLTIFHMILAKWRKDFDADRNQHTAGFYRAVNEVPTAIMAIVVILVIVKPF